MDAFDTKIVNSKNCSLCPFFIWKKKKTALCQLCCWKCLTGWPRKIEGVKLCCQLNFALKGFIMSMRIPLTHSNEVTQFLLHAQIACYTHASVPVHAPNLILLLQVRACVSNVFCALLKLLSWIYFHTASENKMQCLVHSPSKCSPGCSLLSRLNHRRWRSVLEVCGILFSQISCLVKFWLEWKRSSSGLDSNKTLISVVWPQLHTCLRGRRVGGITSELSRNTFFFLHLIK